MPRKKNNFLDKTITYRKLILVALPIVAIVCACSAFFQSYFYKHIIASSSLPNPAKVKVSDIDFVLKSHDAVEVCTSGHNGQGGIDSYELPNYHVEYKVADSKVLDKEIIGYGKRSGFDLGPDSGSANDVTRYKSIVIENPRPDAVPNHGLYDRYEMSVAIYRGDSAAIECGGRTLDLQNKENFTIVDIDVDYKGSGDWYKFEGDNVKHIDYNFNQYVDVVDK